MAKENQKDVITALEEAYILKGVEPVLTFLEVNPGLTNLLIEAYNQIASHFMQARCSLEVITDPEIGYQQLLLSVVTPLEFEEAMNTLDQFRDSWWIENLERTNAELILDVELK